VRRRGGRGLSGELVLLDELREHQSWDAWAAVTKTTNAKERAQIYGISNAGDSSSVVLRYLRKMAHADLGDPDGLNVDEQPADLLGDDEEVDDSALAIFEWSAPPGADVMDRDAWAQANPSLGHRVRESTLASDAKTDPEWVFRTEVLCQWTDGTLEGPFPPGTWDAGRDAESRVAPHESVTLCVDVSWDRSMTHVGLAGRRVDGKVHVEVIASRAGTEWLVPWLTAPERSQRVREASVAVQSSASPAASLVEPLRAAQVPVIEWKGADLGAATGAFYDLVRGDGIRHRPQPNLDVAAATAVTRPLTDAYVWDRKRSPTDVSPLIAVTGAAWFLNDGSPDPQVHEWPTDDELDDWEDE
jgi:hypothetical protein